MTGTYKTEFPDFGELDVVIPEGFHDRSWHNDTQPCFGRKRWPQGDYVYIWVDYADEGRREIPGHPRFHVQLSNPDTGEATDVLATDDWTKAGACVGDLFPKPQYWLGSGPGHCELCKRKIGDVFVDGRVETVGKWALLCPSCHTALGCGLGTGLGQQYERVGESRWLKTAG
jgi:hypothetical protein